MGLISICIDEDAMNSGLVTALRSRGVLVITPLDSGRCEQPDEGQLEYATANRCAIYSFNVSDYYRLHTQFRAEGRNHAGVILSAQQRYSIGEQLRRILRLRAAIPAEAMWNRVEFISRWG